MQWILADSICLAAVRKHEGLSRHSWICSPSNLRHGFGWFFLQSNLIYMHISLTELFPPIGFDFLFWHKTFTLHAVTAKTPPKHHHLKIWTADGLTGDRICLVHVYLHWLQNYENEIDLCNCPEGIVLPGCGRVWTLSVRGWVFHRYFLHKWDTFISWCGLTPQREKKLFWAGENAALCGFSFWHQWFIAVFQPRHESVYIAVSNPFYLCHVWQGRKLFCWALNFRDLPTLEEVISTLIYCFALIIHCLKQ